MGQGGSKSGPLVVHVQLDAGYYYAGDTVTGAVVLHAEQAVDVKAISIKVTGVEKTKWVETRHSSTPSHDVTYRGKHVVFKHKLPLRDRCIIERGDYQWPISFQLPPNIPGTFHYAAADHRASASIEYKVKAVVDQEGFFKSDIKKTVSWVPHTHRALTAALLLSIKEFDVLQRTKAQAPSGPLVLDVAQPISAWCCLNKGHISMRVGAPTDSYLPGDAIDITAQVDNKSSTPVELVEMKLHQRLHLMGDSFLGTINKHIDVVRVATRQQAVNAAQGAPGLLSQYVGRLELDRAIEATCLGKVIRSTYELEVTAKTGCCVSQVKLKQPILINDPQPHTAPPALQPPPGWAPQVYDTVAFAVPVPDCYASWQQAPAMGAPAAPQYTTDAFAQQPYQPAPYSGPGGPVPQQPQQQSYAEQQYQQPTPQYQQPPYQQDVQYAYSQPQQQQYQDYQQPQADHQAYLPAYTAAATYADPQAGQCAAVPGAICYVEQQQQGQTSMNKAGVGGGYMTSGAAAAAVPPGQWSYGYGQPEGAVPAPTAPDWSS